MKRTKAQRVARAIADIPPYVRMSIDISRAIDTFNRNVAKTLHEIMSDPSFVQDFETLNAMVKQYASNYNFTITDK